LPGGASALELFWTAKAKEDLAYWQRKDKRIAAKIEQLVADAREHPFIGLGKPEPLRYEWMGYWSRRITGTHRLLYRVEAGVLYIAQCRFHYAKKS
jgi:toxin YoeB